MGTRGCVSAGLRPRAPGRPRLDRSVSTGPSQGQGRSGTRFLLASSGLGRSFAFSSYSEGYFDLCTVPVSSAPVQSMHAPSDGPVSDSNSCSDGDQWARSNGPSLPGEETDVGLQREPQGTQTLVGRGVPDTPSPPPLALSASPASHLHHTRLKELAEGRATLAGIK